MVHNPFLQTEKKLPFLGPQGLSGEDGRDGVDGRDGKDGINGIDGKGVRGLQGESGKDGKDGRNGIDGTNGKNGVDGINGRGVRDIEREKNDLVITLTDETRKVIALPELKKTNIAAGGVALSGISVKDEGSTLVHRANSLDFVGFTLTRNNHQVQVKITLQTVVTKTADYTATSSDDVILVDATGGDVEITLYTGVSGKELVITRKDGSAKTVTLTPVTGQKIQRQVTQELKVDETYSLVSDGTDWWVNG